ncbi:MAG: flagellar hook protein FlgE [Schwartzia succinivorans]|nr:flagellar hook protein FlgE [Schwartzia succinivorans]
MMRSLFSGVSGLKNHQTRMDVIGNNIANVNTTGFKSGRVNFTDMLSQTLTGASSPNDNIGGTNPKQIGLGSSVGSIDTIFTNGSVQSTGQNTDLCMSGNGLFVVNNGKQQFYTRNGDFQFDANGNYVQAGSGLYVQGWMADDNGSLTTNGATTNIVVEAGKIMAAKATKNADFTLNLNAAEPTIDKITLTDASTNPPTITTPNSAKIANDKQSITLSMSDGSTKTIGSVSPLTYTVGNSVPLVTNLTVYDSVGNGHTVNVMLEKAGANTWYASLNGVNGVDTSTIDEDDGTTTTVTMSKTLIPFKSDGTYDDKTGGAGNISLTYTNGAADQSVIANFSALTQYSGSNTAKGIADGYAAGTLSSLAVDKSGIITGTYTNGQKKSEAQVAVAQFDNASGLTKNGDSLYQESNNSGVPNIRTASDLGVTITPAALEMSNVDVADQFTDMIVTQRGFQSNSKIITVSDEMLETVVNMKR